MGGVLLPHLDFILFASIACLAWALIWIFLAPSRRHRLVVSLLLALMLGGGWLLVQRADQRERHRLTSLLEGFAPTYARELQHLGHWMLPMDVAADDPLYLKIIDAELRWLDSNRAIADVYTFRKRADGKVILLVDSETDYDKNGLIEGEREARTQVGEVYEEVTEGIEQAFAGKASFDDVPYEDRWGVWVSALAPIYDPQGRVEGVVGVDYPAESWIAAVAMARLSAIGFTAIILILLLAASVLHCTFSRQLAERGLAQQALMLSHEQLKATNHELARAMLAAESAAHAKSQFLANMSHEIRTPINGILGFADLLMHEDATTTIADRREWLSIIQSSSHHLLELVNDILDSSKIEAGCMTVERIEARPHQILRDVIGIVRPRAMQRNLELKVIQRTPVPEVILSDPLRLRQILLNLAGNAVKFTERGSVVIEMSISLEDGRQLLRFDVIDTGIGMTEDQIRRVFQPFMQADESTTRKYGGTGLGLSIGWNLAHALGGDIKVRSQVGRGTCFTCTIDPGVIDGTRMIQPEESPLLDDGREAATVSGLQGRRILVADDVPTNQKLLKVILDRMKAQVRIASDGRQAVEMAVAERFDLILMDIHMPEMDGMAAAHRMRELGVKCPLLALTAGVSGEEEKR